MTPRLAELRSMRRRAGQAGGFTLIEVVLALLIVPLIATALYMAFHVATRARDSADRAVSMNQRTTVVADVLTHDLGAILPPSPNMVGPFLGEADWVEFYCIDSTDPPQPSPLSEGIHLIDLGLTSDGNLVRRVTRNLLTDQTNVAEPEEEVICRNVKSFALQYWDGTTWQDQWSSDDQDGVLPTAMQFLVELSYPDSDSRLFRITRVVPLPLAKPAADTTTTTTGAAAGGAP